MPDDQMTLQQFGQKIKAKYPEYNSFSDEDIANKVIAKYPEYKDRVVSSAPASPDFTANPKGEGLYRMLPVENPNQVVSLSSGEIQVPFSKIQDAQSSGYQLHPDERKRYLKDLTYQGRGPTFGEQVRNKFAELTEPVQNPAPISIVPGGNTNQMRAAARTIASVPGYLGQVLAAAYHGKEDNNQELMDLIDPAKLPEGLYKQFQSDRQTYGNNIAADNLVGNIEGMVAVGAITHGLTKAAGGLATKTLQGTADRFRMNSQKMVGAGENAIKREVASQAEAANTTREKAIQSNAAATEKTLADRGKVDEANAAADLLRKQHEQAVEVTDAANNAKMAEHASKVQSVEDANAAAQAEYQAAKAKVDEITQAAQDTETQRGQLARQVQQQSARMIDRLHQVQAAWKDSSELQKSKGYQPVGILDKAYAKLRQMTSGATVPSSALADAVKNAQSKIAGSNESIKIFKDILSKNPDADPEFIDYQGSKIPKTNPLYQVLKDQGHVEENPPPTWKDLQGYYTELGRSLSAGNLPNDVYLALRSLQGDIGGLMDQMASSRGAGALWKTTKAQYRDFMQTFRESTGPNHSGSPIAQALDAKDPAYAIKPLTAEETAQRVRNDLSRFDPPVNGVGGAAKLYDNFRDVSRQFDSLPKPIKIPEAPVAPTPAPTPVAPSLAPRPTLPKGAEPVPYSEPHPTTPIEVPEIDTRALREKFIEDRLHRWTNNISAFQFGRLVASPISMLISAVYGSGTGEAIGASWMVGEYAPFVLQKLFEKPAVREWFTRPPEGELESLQKLPYADRVKIIDGMNRTLIAARKAGKPIPISPAVGAFLSGHTKPFETKEQYLKRLRDEHQVSGITQ